MTETATLLPKAETAVDERCPACRHYLDDHTITVVLTFLCEKPGCQCEIDCETMEPV